MLKFAFKVTSHLRLISSIDDSTFFIKRLLIIVMGVSSLEQMFFHILNLKAVCLSINLSI